jgi:organic hydroperoxide reductase OsmC/OhrA
MEDPMAAVERTARARVERVENFRFTATFPDVPHAAPLALDEPSPLGGDFGPNPGSLLAAAIADCLAASLVFCLRKARVNPVGVAADAEARIVRNDAGRMRISDVDVTLSLQLTDEQRTAAERCVGLFQDFCIVTESVRHGIPVHVHVVAPESDLAGSGSAR